jgi:hypothetical protein
MARIRSVKPELRTSLVVAEWPREVRYFWVLLWGYLDDHGRGVDDARLIKADCLPLDDDVTRHMVDEWIASIAKDGPLCRYDVAGKRYLHAPSWSEHQRPSHPSPSKIPPCPLHEGSGDFPESLAKPSGDTPETLVPEQVIGAGNRSREQVIGAGAAHVGEAADDPDFDRFWEIYPRKEAKGGARKAWTAARKKTPAQSLITGAERYRDSQRGTEPRYIAMPATWLNGERWNDQPTTGNGSRASPAAWTNYDDQSRYDKPLFRTEPSG